MKLLQNYEWVSVGTCFIPRALITVQHIVSGLGMRLLVK